MGLDLSKEVDRLIYEAADELKEACYTEDMGSAKWDELCDELRKYMHTPEFKKVATLEQGDTTPRPPEVLQAENEQDLEHLRDLWRLVTQGGFELPPIQD